MIHIGTKNEDVMEFSRENLLSRRGFCLCCVGGAAFTAAGGWLTPRQAFAEARGLVSLIKDSAAVSPIVTHKLRNNINVFEGSGGNIGVLTGPDGKVLIDAGIGVSRPQITTPRRTPENIFPKFNASRIGIIISFRCDRAGYPARFLQASTA